MDIYNGDARDILKRIPDGSISLCITDPPYRFESKGGGFYGKNKSTRRKYAEELRLLGCTDFSPGPFLEALRPKMKKFNGYFFCNKSLLREYIEWAINNKYTYDILVMAKQNPIPIYNNHHLSDLEYIVMIREKGAPFNKGEELDVYRKFFLTTCKKRRHPAEKPVELLKRFVLCSSPEGGVVLDPFCGSGSTGVACCETGREFIGIEIDWDYYGAAAGRLWRHNQGKVNAHEDYE